MQKGMLQFASIMTPAGTTIALAIKVAVAAGPRVRFLVGDPNRHQMMCSLEVHLQSWK